MLSLITLAASQQHPAANTPLNTLRIVKLWKSTMGERHLQNKFLLIEILALTFSSAVFVGNKVERCNPIFMCSLFFNMCIFISAYNTAIVSVVCRAICIVTSL